MGSGWEVEALSAGPCPPLLYFPLLQMQVPMEGTAGKGTGGSFLQSRAPF